MQVIVLQVFVFGKLYSLLCELTSTLVLAVPEEFDDTALVGGETVELVVSKTVQ